MQQILDFLRDTFHTLRNGGFPELGMWSYVLLALLAATEGPLSVLLGAAAASAGYLRPDWVYFAAVTGNLIGDTAWYYVGYAGKPQRFARIGRFLGMHPDHITKLEGAMRQHATKVILLAKLSITLMVPTLVAAGIARVPWRKWFPVVFCIELVWTGVLVWVGYHATGLISSVEHGMKTVGILVLLAVILGITWYVHRIIRREEEIKVPAPVRHAPPTLVTKPAPRPQPKPRSENPPLRFMLDNEHSSLEDSKVLDSIR